MELNLWTLQCSVRSLNIIKRYGLKPMRNRDKYFGPISFPLNGALRHQAINFVRQAYKSLLQRPTDVSWLFGFKGISNFVGYLTPNPFFENSSILNNSI